MLEQLYLYLKEKVVSGADLSALSDELHEHVYSLVSTNKASDVIGVLLDMHILEDEQYILRQRINALLSPGGRERAQESPSQGSFFAAEAKDSSQDPNPNLSPGGVGSKFASPEGSPNPNPSPSPGPKRGHKGGSDDKEAPVLSPPNLTTPLGEDPVAALLKTMTDRHKQTLGALRQALEGEKDRRLAEIEKRLLRLVLGLGLGLGVGLGFRGG